MLQAQIEATARRFPQRTALVSSELTLTYRQLNQAANGLARQLTEQGVVSGDRVAVLLAPCPQTVISLLALLKLGAVYAPLDVEHPASRLQLLLDDLEPNLVLTDAQHQSLLPSAIPRLLLHQPGTGEPVTEVVADPRLNLDPAAPAYLFFTSGTTGRPKAVLATSANLIHYPRSAIRQFGMDSDTVMPTVARVSFSISLFELLCPLLAGGCVRILSRNALLDIPRLVNLMQTFTMLHMGPSLLNVVLRYLEDNQLAAQQFAHLRHVSFGGDLVKPELLQRLLYWFPQAEIYVIYGCTELACMVTYQRITATSLPQRPSIGQPFPGVKLDFRDAEGQPVTYPEWGEIYVAGDGVSAGYLNRPELTEQRYLYQAGRRYYRTGDLARYSPQGYIEFLGRKDHQVQMHGIRIELGEIESHLTAITGVKEAIAAGVPDENEELALVAYLVLDATCPPSYQTIRQTLEHRLPKYLIPKHYVRLEKLPLNHNLKVDRLALPPPQQSHLLNQTTGVVEPGNEVEQELLTLWRLLFQRQDIGINHNFFDLGGDSLKAIDLIIAIEQRLGERVPISELLHHPTISELARHINRPRHANPEDDLFVLQQGEPGPAVFLIHGALIYKDVCDYLPPQLTVCVLYQNNEAQSLGQDDIPGLMASYSSIRDIARRYLAAIKSYQPEGPYYLVGFSIGGLIAMEISQALIAGGDEVGDMILIDSHIPAFAQQARWRKVWYHAQQIFSRGLPHVRYLLWKVWMQLRPQQASAHSTDPQDHAHKEELRRQARNHAAAGYQPRLYHQKAVLFKASERPQYEVEDPYLGWGQFVNNMEVHDLPGDHNQLLRAENAFRIARAIIQHCIKRQPSAP